MKYGIWHGVVGKPQNTFEWYPGCDVDEKIGYYKTFTDINEAYRFAADKKRIYPTCVYDVKEIW